MTKPSPQIPVEAPAPAAPTVSERPGFEVIPLDCEITSYAPDGDDPRL